MYDYPENICFECNCCGLCCGDTEQKTRHILLLESEAKDISAQTKLPIKEFAQKVTDKTPYVYEMKKFTDGKCMFLKNDLCSIYQARPLICRFYPFELRFDQDKNIHVFSYTLECPMIKNGGRFLVKKDFKELFLLAMHKLL